jgi:RNA polymerase sigma factor (TIGR02999 family)
MAEITWLLTQAAQGDRSSENQLLDAIYTELHRLASQLMRQERGGHTLQPTALVNEAYLRLIGGKQISWQSRSHFYHAAAQTMRRILIDHARALQTRKREGALAKVELDDNVSAEAQDPALYLSIDHALSDLQALDARQAKVVELRFFAGLSVEQTAEVLNISPKTVKRDWALARVWLEDRLRLRRAAGSA